jgi:SAM-dependent MidA family methyltransferase
MTPLEKIIREIIALQGPMPFDEYMALCLYHPQHGYYMTRDPFGAKGDFITAPEISQIFGEMVALWAIEAWQKLGSPSRFTLLECGPGRGTLMHDLLRAAGVAPDFLNAADVRLMEISPYLRGKQQETLQAHKIMWVDGVDELPAQPTLMIGNEFFDAFPVKRFQGKKEQRVIIKDNLLAFEDGGEGTISEASPSIEKWLHDFCPLLKANGGAALVIDYAHANAEGADSLQALRGHKYVSVFEAPGEADITAYVDFALLQKLATGHGLTCSPVASQRDFLLHYGLALRLERLLASHAAESQTLIEGAARLTDINGMGGLFKALAFHT